MILCTYCAYNFNAINSVALCFYGIVLFTTLTAHLNVMWCDLKEPREAKTSSDNGLNNSGLFDINHERHDDLS